MSDIHIPVSEELRKQIVRDVAEKSDTYYMKTKFEVRDTLTMFMAAAILVKYQDVVADTLMQCLSEGVTGRNQEDRCVEAVLKRYDEDISVELRFDEDDREMVEMHLDAMISSMRVYDTYYDGVELLPGRRRWVGPGTEAEGFQ